MLSLGGKSEVVGSDELENGGVFIGNDLLPQSSWAMWYRNKIVVISDKVIAQIRATPTKTPGWFEEELGQGWKHIFPLPLASIRKGNLALDHPAWNLTPNPWWKFLMDVPTISMEASEELRR